LVAFLQWGFTCALAVLYRSTNSRKGECAGEALFFGEIVFYYQHHIGDFLRDTSRLTDSQCMAYLRLLWIYYDTELPLPNQPDRIAFQIGASPTDVRLILEHYFQLDGDVYRHGRCDAEIAKYHEKSEKSAKAANARWENAKAKRGQSGRNADASLSDANQEPRTNNQSSSSTKKRSTHVQKPVDVSNEVWASFLTVRKSKKAAVTDLAILGIRREAVKAGLDLEQALTICCERGWAGFEAEWIQKNRPAQRQTESFYERDKRLKLEEAAKWNGGSSSEPDDFLTIDGEVRHVIAD
jgi:uncharacterized protein YdaU (DUF1376 family)